MVDVKYVCLMHYECVGMSMIGLFVYGWDYLL